MSRGCSAKVYHADCQTGTMCRHQRYCEHFLGGKSDIACLKMTEHLHTYLSNDLQYFSKLTLTSVHLSNLQPTFLTCSDVDTLAEGVGGDALRSPLSPVSGKLPSRVLRKVVFRDWLIVRWASPRCNSDERRVGVHWGARVRWHLQNKRKWLIIAVWIHGSNKAPRHH